MLSSLLSIAWPEFGKLPSGEHAAAIARSPNYNCQSDRFVNRNQSEYDKMMDSFDYPALMKEQIFGKQLRTPKFNLPQVLPEPNNWSDDGSLVYHWLGHSTILLRIDDTTILIDPVFTNAAPIPFAVPRFQDPVLPLGGLPEIDLILISHDHYDHLDKRSVQHFVNKDTKFIVPLGVSSYLMGWGIEHHRITELDWWQESTFSTLTVACTPSQHFSGRTGPRGNKTLWASWVVIGENQRFYFSGDSGYDNHFLQIGDRYGPFDVAFMESGQYNPIWPLAHMFPNETVQAAVDVNAQKVQPIHWGMFKLSTHDWFEPVEMVKQHGIEKNIEVLYPQIGAAVYPSKDITNEVWWK